MKVTALLYHDVVPPGRFETSGFGGADGDLYKLEEAEFGRHLGAIEARLPSPVRLVADAEDDAVLLTFDDGGATALHIADEIERRGWLGHFLMTADWIGKPGFLDAAGLRDLQRRGHVVGSHSCSHPLRMAALSDQQLEYEWRESVRRLQDVLSAPVKTASIPGGLYGKNVARAAAGAGIRHLFSSEPVRSVWTVDGCRVYGRFAVQQGVSAEWVGGVVAGDLWPRLSRKVYWDAKKVLKKAGGEAWMSARRALLAWRASAPGPGRHP